MDSRVEVIEGILERLAKTDEHVVKADHREVLGESIRAVGPIPAIALGAGAQEGSWRPELVRSLEYCGALCLRVVLSAREQPPPTAQEVLGMLDAYPGGNGVADWISQDPLWGRVANLVFSAAEAAHVTNSVEADCYSCLAMLKCCVEFLGALRADMPS